MEAQAQLDALSLALPLVIIIPVVPTNGETLRIVQGGGVARVIQPDRRT